MALVAALAQLVEHRIRNAGATGSSPVSGTIFLLKSAIFYDRCLVEQLYILVRLKWLQGEHRSP